MTSRTTISVAWLWIASLFVATVGVSGTQIYCYCVGKTTLSFFSAEDACAEMHAEKSGSCCSKTSAKLPRACCEKPHKSNASEGCTKKTTKVFQLKTEFTVQEKLFQQIAFPVFGLFASIAPFTVFPALLIGPKKGLPTLAQPPPLPGRMMCVRYGVFRC